MGNLEVIARFKIRPGQGEVFRSQVAEVLRVTRERDTHTLRCDWFVNADGTDCEVHEAFSDENGLVEHKMNTMEPTLALFNDSVFDHQASIYGDVSQDFIDLVTQRMGKPTVYSFAGGLTSPAAVSRGPVPAFEVKAHMKVRPGQLQGFKAQAAELLRLTREKDTKTLRYDWFIDENAMQGEVHENYVDESGLLEHNDHIFDARSRLFEKYAYDHQMTVFADISPHLRELFDRHAGGVALYRFFQGLEEHAAV